MDEKIVLNRMIISLEGDLQAKGVKIPLKAWLVLGSMPWLETSDKMRAEAYSKARKSGWTEEALLKIMCAAFPHIDKYMALFTIDLLKEICEKCENN